MAIKYPPITAEYLDDLKAEYIGKPGTLTRGALDGPLARVYKKIKEDIEVLNKVLVAPPAPPTAPPAPQPTQPEETQTP